ncbi:hypothetical protein ACHAQH_004279 [Verticillium albo-atrum]
MARPSVFLQPGPKTTAGSLAIIQLSRDNLIPLILEDSTTERDGYAEGATLNTRFGSFPHSTFIGVPWGSQVRASTVDTGSRGRKRKRKDGEDDESKVSTPNPADDFETPTILAPAKKAVTANSGFVHILQPTPELWTQSLPHRTQVVYTPDYSYVLSRIRALPGTRLIEAGAGSGSFTHASVRAVFDGYPKSPSDPRGKVYSYEFNHGRYEKMQEEIASHHLIGLVQLTHRDAYTGGFLVDGASPNASSVFLDLPAPWDALPHLSRSRPTSPDYDEKFPATAGPWVSPLDPSKAAHICTFSPCIEQVQRTISAMRRLGWIDIDMVEIAHRKINVLRERFPSTNPPERKAPPEPNNVIEAVSRLRDIERRAREYDPHKSKAANAAIIAASNAAASPMDVDETFDETAGKPWLQGRLVHRSEAELKAHTSYLVFATLPREWSEDDEAALLAKWPCGSETTVVGSVDKATRKREKREMLAKKKQKRQGARPEGADAVVADQVVPDAA